MAPNGAIWIHPKGPLWSEDYASAELSLCGLFVHELTHVWQHQCGRSLVLCRHPFCSYRYEHVPGRPFSRYGIEQQAEIVRHAWEGMIGRRPRDQCLETLLPARAATDTVAEPSASG